MITKKPTLMHRPQDPMLASGVLLYEGSGRCFNDGMEKRASADIVKQANITPEPGHAYVHLVSVAAGDFFGKNSNDDFYTEGPIDWTFPLAKGGPRVEKLAGGLTQYHSTYMNHGGVYREHQNSKRGFQKLGSIAFERYNPEMHYGELIVKLPVQEWSNTIQKLATNMPVFWSQGSSLVFDLCSVCGNRRTNEKTACEHIRFNRGQMTPEGHAVFMINTEPVFHDISEVAVPAEKIAFALQKVASHRQVDASDIVFPNIQLPMSVVASICGTSGTERYALLQKLAAEEADVKANKSKADKAVEDAVHLEPEAEAEIAGKLKHLDIPDMQGNLISKKCMLTPRGFACILVSKAGGNPEDPAVAAAIERMRGLTPELFTNILSSGAMGETLDDGSYVANCCPTCGKAVVDEVAPELSLEPQAIAARAVKKAVSDKKPGKKIEKAAASDPRVEQLAQSLAGEYAKYQLTAVAALNAGPSLIRTAVLINQ